MKDKIMDMAKVIPSNITAYMGYTSQLHLFLGQKKEIATALVNKGYGDTKQAVEEFAEKIKENLEEIFDLAVKKGWGRAYEYINQLVKDFCEQN